MPTVTAFIRSTAKDRDKETFVRFRLTDGRSVQIFYRSQLSIAPKYWSNDTQSIKARVAYNELARIAFNSAIAKIKEKIEKWYVSAPKDSRTADALRAYMDGNETADPKRETFEELYERFIVERRISSNRRRQMRVTLREVHRFERYRTALSGAPFTFAPATVSTRDIHDFERFLEEEYIIARQYPNLYEGVREIEQRGRNTILLKLTFLRAFFRWAFNEGIIPTNPFRGIKMDDEVYGTPIYLTKEEMRHLAEYPFSNPTWATQRDIFIFQSCIGCRYSDLQQLTGRSVSGGFVEYIARKTRDDRPITVRVPLNQTAREILARYHQDDDNAPLLPFYANQPFNRIIKEIAREAGLDRWVQTLNTKTREPEQKRLYEVISSHTARKNFIGNIFRVVRDQSIVSALTGHKQGSKAFARYRTIDDEMRRDMVAILDE